NDELPRVLGNRWSSRSRHGDRTPVATESLAVPADHGLWLDDDESVLPSRPEPREGDPEGAIQPRETWQWSSRSTFRASRVLSNLPLPTVRPATAVARPREARLWHSVGIRLRELRH